MTDKDKRDPPIVDAYKALDVLKASLRQQAQEIERLRDHLGLLEAEAHEDYQQHESQLGAGTLRAEAAEAERDALRAALQRIVIEAERDDGLTAWDGADIARAALRRALP